MKWAGRAGICAGCLIFLFAGLTGCAGGKPGEQDHSEKIILKLGTETAFSTPETRGAQKLADLVREKSKGTLVIEVYENAKLGTMKERDEGMRMGTVDMGTSSVGFLASYVPVLGVFDLPYLYKDKAHELRVFDGEIGQEIDKKLQAQGLRVVCYFDAGTRQITNNRRPIHSLSDLKGLRIRVPQTTASIEGFKALGAVPTPLAFGELYPALRQGVVEAQENPVSIKTHNRLYEVQKYLSLTHHQMFIQVLTISEKIWQKLSPKHRKDLMDSAIEAQKYQRDIAAAEEVSLISVLREKGMEVNEIGDISSFSSRVKPLREIYIKRIGLQAKDLFEKIDALRN